MSGLALLTLALCGWLIDVRGWRAWARPAVVFGSNPLVAFVGSGLLARILGLVKIDGSEGARISLKAALYSGVCRPLVGPVNGSLLYAIGTVVFWWAGLWVMYRLRVFIKV